MEGVASSILVAPTVEAPRETWGLRPFLGVANVGRVTDSSGCLPGRSLSPFNADPQRRLSAPGSRERSLSTRNKIRLAGVTMKIAIVAGAIG